MLLTMPFVLGEGKGRPDETVVDFLSGASGAAAKIIFGINLHPRFDFDAVDDFFHRILWSSCLSVGHPFDTLKVCVRIYCL